MLVQHMSSRRSRETIEISAARASGVSRGGLHADTKAVSSSPQAGKAVVFGGLFGFCGVTLRLKMARKPLYSLVFGAKNLKTPSP